MLGKRLRTWLGWIGVRTNRSCQLREDDDGDPAERNADRRRKPLRSTDQDEFAAILAAIVALSPQRRAAARFRPSWPLAKLSFTEQPSLVSMPESTRSMETSGRSVTASG
jgi:hypothetical protein